jgi:hypothetical protein
MTRDGNPSTLKIKCSTKDSKPSMKMKVLPLFASLSVNRELDEIIAFRFGKTIHLRYRY